MEGKRAPDTHCLGKLFRGHAHREYARHRQALELIFSNHFPEWPRSSQRTLETTLGIPINAGTPGSKSGSKAQLGGPGISKFMVRIIASSATRRREQSVTTSPRIIFFPGAYSPRQCLFKLGPLLGSKNIATRSLFSNFNVPLASLPISSSGITSHPVPRT
jgi:hypothetical protein